MDLYILRHGLAGEHGSGGYESAADRPLTAEGRHKLRRIAQAMKALDLSFDLILSRPYARARQTAEIVAAGLRAMKKLEFSDDLIPEGNSNKLIDLLNRRQPASEKILLVGHEPYLSELIALLLSGDASLAIVMKKGGLCKLSADSLQPGRCATL